MTTPAGPRIGSLFSGAGGLDLAVLEVLGGTVAWHSQYEPPDKKGHPDVHQYAARILAHHWPQVPNLGDITTVDWDQVLAEHGPVDVLIGGFPCGDLSLAGKQAGLVEGTRSGLWLHMARAIKHLQPSLVIIENVRGLLSAPAHSDVEPCPWCLGDRGDEPVLRALGCVLGDLAELGFDAEWHGLPASHPQVGSCHERFRVFIAAWPSDAARPGLEDRRQGRPGRGADAPEDPDVEPGDQRRLPAPRQAESGRPRAHAGGRGGTPAPDTESIRRGEGGAEPARILGGPDDALRGGEDRAPVEWGAYEGAVRRWERIRAVPVPSPVDDRGRLAPELPEWMMGYAPGWITAVPPAPGMSRAQARNAQLKAAGNGVVVQQAAYAIPLLLARMPAAALQFLAHPTTVGAQHAH